MARRKAPQTKQIQAPHWDNYEVVFIKSLEGPDSEWVQDQLTEMVTSKKPTTDAEQEARMSILLGKTQRLTLLRGILEWTFTDQFNNQLPWPALTNSEASNVMVYRIRNKSLEQVMPEDRAFISAAINELSSVQTLTDEEKKASLNSVSDGFQADQPMSLIQ